jgi:hypothetical protein
MAHSRFGASAAHRWMRCPGSVKASEGLPNPSSPAAQEGTMLHEAAANTLLGLDVHYELTDEQQEVIDAYIEVVKNEVGDGQLFVEQRFKLPHHTEFWGTADAVIENGDTLKVIDLKAGRGIEVKADYAGKLNPQLGFYALGAMAALNRTDWKTVEIIIVQPRFGGVKRRLTDVTELNDLAMELVDAALRAESDEPPFEAGSHCHFCLAKATCPTLRNEVYRLARMEFDDVAA